MLAAVYHGINDLRVEDIVKPAIGEDEALLRVKAAAICGTDLRILASGHFKIPQGTRRILGHEFAGEVVEVGPQASGLVSGTRIAIAPNVGCGTCQQCIQGRDHLCPNYEAFGISFDGAFAEYIRIPAAFIRRGNILPVPDGIYYEEAALNEPFSCCYHGSRACHIEPGDVVLIVGAGPIGIMHLLLARLSGASTVIVSEMIEERRLQALEFGADMAVDPVRQDLLAAVREASQGRGADVIIVAAPAPPAQEQSLDLAAIRGRINFFGGLPKESEFIRFQSNRVHYREITVTGTTGSSNYEFRRSMEIMASGRIALSPLISARFPLSEAQEAFAVAAGKKALKVLITPQEE
jgi:L-iditol 2-dehydrogenase